MRLPSSILLILFVFAMTSSFAYDTIWGKVGHDTSLEFNLSTIIPSVRLEQRFDSGAAMFISSFPPVNVNEFYIATSGFDQYPFAFFGIPVLSFFYIEENVSYLHDQRYNMLLPGLMVGGRFDNDDAFVRVGAGVGFPVILKENKVDSGNSPKAVEVWGYAFSRLLKVHINVGFYL